MRLAKHVENEDTWQKVCRSGNAQTPRHGNPKGTGKVSGKGSGKGKSKSKQRTPETCLCCGKQGHKKADCKFKTATCSNRGKVDHLRAVCRNTNTHEIQKDADEPSPQVTVEAVWCLAVPDTVEDGHFGCVEKHDVSSEHCDESKFTEFPEHRDESKFSKVIKSIETDQNPRKAITNIETGQNSEK